MIVQLDHVQVAGPVGCEPAARAFYGGVLGLRELARPQELDGIGGCWFACGSLQLHVGTQADFVPARKAHPAFRVDDLNGLRAALREGGYPVLEDRMVPGVERFFSADPWGNRLEFVGA
jgi:catechol 2,3-dioxygenase-like lactoylglutathione lyase family enzyme